MENVSNKDIVTNSNWFKHWFDSSFYQKLYAKRNEKEAASFVDELVKEFQPAAGSCMLDLGCGNGRHSKYLASKGFDVTGIDLAASSIHDAKRSETEKLKFFCLDMRRPYGKNIFDYVFNFFTSFGYFNDPADDHKVIRNISRALKPGGIFVMDYINPVLAEKKLVAAEKKEIDGIKYNINRWANETFIFKNIVVDEILFGKPLEYTEQVKKFRVEDLEQLFSSNGLELTAVFGDYSLNIFDKETSPRMILIAKKTTHETGNI